MIFEPDTVNARAAAGGSLLAEAANKQLCPKHLQGRPVCAAVMRAFGAQLAEVPLVATKADARRQGHCRVLMQAFEAILREVSLMSV